MSTSETPHSDAVRFLDVLTTASAVAHYLGAPEVQAAHLLSAIEILRGRMTMEDLGRPVSPLVPRARPGTGAPVDPKVRQITERWYADLGVSPDALIEGANLEMLRQELAALD